MRFPAGWPVALRPPGRCSNILVKTFIIRDMVPAQPFQDVSGSLSGGQRLIQPLLPPRRSAPVRRAPASPRWRWATEGYSLAAVVRAQRLLVSRPGGRLVLRGSQVLKLAAARRSSESDDVSWSVLLHLPAAGRTPGVLHQQQPCWLRQGRCSSARASATTSANRFTASIAICSRQRPRSSLPVFSLHAWSCFVVYRQCRCSRCSSPMRRSATPRTRRSSPGSGRLSANLQLV